MSKLFVQNLVTLDGYVESSPWGLEWHNVDAEFFAAHEEEIWGNLGGIVYGRKTYEGMYKYWTSEEGLKDSSKVAEKLLATPKFVVSSTLKNAEWKNTTVLHDLTELAKVKEKMGDKQMVIFGSSDLCASLLEAGMLDEVKQIVNPVLLGHGKPMFQGLKKTTKLKLLRTRTFKNGNVLLVYEPEKR